MTEYSSMVSQNYHTNQSGAHSMPRSITNQGFNDNEGASKSTSSASSLVLNK